MVYIVYTIRGTRNVKKHIGGKLDDIPISYSCLSTPMLSKAVEAWSVARLSTQEGSKHYMVLKWTKSIT